MDQAEASILFERLSAALAGITGVPPRILVDVAVPPGTYRPDAIMELEHEGHAYQLVLDAKRVLFPRDAREAVWQLRTYLAQVDGGGRTIIPVLVADSISPGARQLLRGERFGYFDASGSLFLPASSLYVHVDRPPSQKQSRSLNNLFSGRRAQALHAVWRLGGDWFGVHQIAERAGVSPATASETLSNIERRDWVEVRGAGPTKERRLSNPRALLDAWTDYQTSVKPKALRHFYVRSTTPQELQRRIDQVCTGHGLAYEFTGVTAGQHHAPFLTSVSQVFCRVQNGSNVKAMLDDLEARPVREGWNLGLYDVTSDNELRFREREDELWMADPLQTYLDLLQAGGRAKELAQHLRQERLNS